jgi:hypothetical protein
MRRTCVQSGAAEAKPGGMSAEVRNPTLRRRVECPAPYIPLLQGLISLMPKASKSETFRVTRVR